MSDDCENGEKYPKYTVRAGAGMLDAHVEAESAKEAFQIWEKSIDKLVETVEDWDVEERNKIGLE